MCVCLCSLSFFKALFPLAKDLIKIGKSLSLKDFVNIHICNQHYYCCSQSHITKSHFSNGHAILFKLPFFISERLYKISDLGDCPIFITSFAGENSAYSVMICMRSFQSFTLRPQEHKKD